MGKKTLLVLFILIALTIAAMQTIWPKAWILLLIWIPLLGVAIYDMVQTKHAIMRNYPIFGRGRYIMEELRPKIYQYFIESDTDGTPINRINRSVVYQRAKRVLDSRPFGTQLDVNAEGYEWINHSIGALDFKDLEEFPRVRIGGADCTQPYDCSLLNISAMSFGSLSKAAIEALNGGAALGGFAHNTGEGGISDYHLSHNGDLVYQIGTGYFGSRDEAGNFSPEEFAKKARLPQVRMIEIKLSQGAKPGHGGILPGKKNTPEIAKIRNVKPGETVLSPPYHTAFSTPIELLEFIQQCRTLANGKPVGFKLCVGRKTEFIAICKAMIETGIKPDFITVDGGEGGTGAAPLEFTNSVGTPIREGLTFVYDCLVGFSLKSEIKIIASGMVLTGFDIFKGLALGADACNSARGMMLSLGCIQALLCNSNTCPTGVATQDPNLVTGLVVSDKKVRVCNYHNETIEAFMELLAASGKNDHASINRTDVYRRISYSTVKRYDDLYPLIEPGSLLDESSWPEDWYKHMVEASASQFVSDYQL